LLDQRDRVRRRNVRQFFDEQVPESISLPILSVVLDADVSKGIGWIPKIYRRYAVDFNGDAVFNTRKNLSLASK
jgi:hypothetical protein